MFEQKECIAWIDVETTGLNAEQDCLLEVACLVTDTNLNVLDETGYHAVVYYPQTYVEMLKARSDAYVLDMHAATGLWDKLPTGNMLATIDTDLLDYIKKFAPHQRTAYLGGNSITLDRNFLNSYLPGVAAHLHYRSIDVTTIAKLAQWWIDADLKYPKELLHTAFDDIRESVAELRFYRDTWLNNPNPGYHMVPVAQSARG